MLRSVRSQLSPPPVDRAREPRRRRWRRWVVVGIVVLAALAALGDMAAVKFQTSAPRLGLPGGPVAAPVGSVDGTWHAAAGSVAGFRVRASALGVSNEITGRTDAVTGTLVIGRGQVTQAEFRVDLTDIKQPQFATSLGAKNDPSATVTLASPVALSPGFMSGTAATMTAEGYLTLRGVTRPVTLSISARQDGTALQAAGQIPVAFSQWGITRPFGLGIFGSLAGHGTAEFLLVLHRQASITPGNGTAG